MTRLLLALGVFAITVSPAAQAIPDFSGRWVAVSPGGAVGQVLVVTQTESAITLEPGILPNFTAGYPLSGAPVVAVWDGRRVTLSACWRHGKLLLVDAPHDPAIRRHERAIAFDRDGHLVLETLRPQLDIDAEPIFHSERVLHASRVVFERR